MFKYYPTNSKINQMMANGIKVPADGYKSSLPREELESLVLAGILKREEIKDEPKVQVIEVQKLEEALTEGDTSGESSEPVSEIVNEVVKDEPKVEVKKFKHKNK